MREPFCPTSIARDIGPRALFAFFAVLVVSVSFDAQDVHAEFLREYDFVRLGEVADFLPKQLAYSNTGELLVFGPAGNVNTFQGNGSNIGRWTFAGGLEELLPGPLPTLFVHDVSQDGSVVIGRRSSIPERGFRWTPAGGYEELSPTPGWAYGVSADGSTIGGFDSQPGVTTPLVWQDIASPIELEGSDESYVVHDVDVDDDGNIWATGGLPFSRGGDSVVWRNGQIVYELPDPVGAYRIAKTANGIRALMRRVAPFDSVVIDFPNADPNNPVDSAISFNALEMTSDGSMFIGIFNSFQTGPLTTISAPGPDVWGIGGIGTSTVETLLDRNLPEAKQQEVGLANWQFTVNDNSNTNPFLDIAVYRDGDVTRAAFVARGINPDGQLEAFLVTVEATPIPEPGAIGLVLIACITMVSQKYRPWSRM